MLSIDITDRQIKLIRGVHGGSKIRIQDAELRELSLGMISNGYVTDVPMVAAELNDILKTKDIKEKDAVVSITSSSIVYKELIVAKPKNMKNPVIIEAMIQSEMNISKEYNISYTIAGETEDAEKNKMIKVIAAACPQRLVDGYIRLFQNIGLNLKAVNISNNAITRLIVNTPDMAKRMPFLLVQVDKGFLNMNLYENNQLAFSRFATIDPSDYENAPDYLARAIYSEVFKMMQFVRSRKDARAVQEVLFYGEIDSFIEISNAISTVNIPSNTLTMPNTISKGNSVQFDFLKFANAIGALYQRNKTLEHINLLEATSAKEAKGASGFGGMILGALVASVAVVGGVYAVFAVMDSNYNKEVARLQSLIDQPQMQEDLRVVAERTTMLDGFENYNATVGRAKDLYNFQPKPISEIEKKVREPLDDTTDKLLDANQELEISNLSVSGNEVTVTFYGQSKGDPTPVPSKYVNYLINKVKNGYDEPYFTNIEYTGFNKQNVTDWGTYAIISNKDKDYDTVFTFEVKMYYRMGNDEVNAQMDTGESEEIEGEGEAEDSGEVTE